jgi:predicted Zn-dependent protease
MSRRLPHLTLAAAALLAAACSDTDRASTGSTSPGSTTTVSTGAATPAGTPSPTGSAAKLKPYPVAGGVVPTYADAERAFHRGRYEEAASMFEAYSESDPENAWGHYMLGLSAWKTGDHTRALEAFDAALRIEPSHRKSLLNSARVLLEIGRPKDALARVQQALAIEPLSSDGLRLLGRSRYELGEIDQAIDAYQRAIAIDDRDTWAMNNLGFIYIQQGRSQDALPPLARAVELRSNVPVFQNNFGTALERSGHFVSAKQAYEGALTADSTYAKAAVGLARVTAHGAESDTSTVDVASLSREFQAQVEEWRTRAVTADSAKVKGAGEEVDSADTTGMVRDSVTK